jgi:hypothetical protein
MPQRFSDYARRERDDYPTPDWVTGLVIPHLKVMGANTIWEPAAGEGSMADALAGAGFRVVSTDLNNGVDFLDDKTWPKTAQRADAVVTNPPYGKQGRTAAKFIEQALELTRPRNGLVAMLLKVDFDSGATRRRFFADCPAWACKLVLLKRILWFESNGNTPSDNHAWFLWSWRYTGSPMIAYSGDKPGTRITSDPVRAR